MDRNRCRQIEDSALKAMKGIEKELGIKITFKGGQIGSSFCVLKYEFAEVKADGSVETREATNYKLYAKSYGLPEDGMGKTFMFRGRQYKVAGMKPGCKYNIIGVRQPDGKTFCFQDRTAFPGSRKPLFGSQPVPPAPGEDDDDDDVERRIAEVEGQD